jgi:hypothetical protein
MTRLNWQRVVLPHAADIVNSYDTGVTRNFVHVALR